MGRAICVHVQGTDGFGSFGVIDLVPLDLVRTVGAVPQRGKDRIPKIQLGRSSMIFADLSGEGCSSPVRTNVKRTVIRYVRKIVARNGRKNVRNIVRRYARINIYKYKKIYQNE